MRHHAIDHQPASQMKWHAASVPFAHRRAARACRPCSAARRSGSANGRGSRPAARAGSAARPAGPCAGGRGRALGIGDRRGRQQRLGVGMLRAAPDLVAPADLDQRAEIHHRHPVGDVLDHREVVADEKIGDAEPALEVLQQVDHLGAHRHVERRDGLVADDQLGAERQRAGDADALALAAGEFVRIALLGVGRQADPAQQRRRPARRWPSAFQPAMTSGWATERPTVERGLSEP